MGLSARNQLAGTVKSIRTDAIMVEVVISLDGGQEVVSVITADSARRLGLEQGTRVAAVIKATEVLVSTDGA